MALHSVMKVGYVVSMIYELRKANLRIALTTLSFILAVSNLLMIKRDNSYLI